MNKIMALILLILGVLFVWYLVNRVNHLPPSPAPTAVNETITEDQKLDGHDFLEYQEDFPGKG